MNAARPHRHLDPDTIGSPLAALPGLTGDANDRSVAVLIDPAAAATVRGQMLAWVTVNLLARLYGALGHIRLACPEADLVADLPALTAEAGSARTLAQALTALADALADERKAHPRLSVFADARLAADGADATLIVGSASPVSVTASAWLITASAWKFAVINATVGVSSDALPTLAQPGPGMVAAWFAAAVGVGEAFKAITGMRVSAGSHVRTLTGNLWAGVIGESMDALSESAGADGPTADLALPPHWLAGVGAVGQTYLAVLSTSAVTTDIGSLDHDVLDERNLNRHPVAGVLDIGAPKAALAQQRLRTGNTRIFALPYTWQGFTHAHPDDRPPLPAGLDEPARTSSYGLVISAVDKNPARLTLAAAHPQLIFSGSTNGLAVEVGRYARDSPWQCLACASPIESEPTLEQTAQSLKDMTDDDLTARAANAGVEPDRLRAYLAEPTCGTLGAREMEKFAAATQPDWSVSFVSVAAGALLAARVLAHAGCGSSLVRAAAERGDTVRLWLLMRRGVFGTTAHRRRGDCRICHSEASVSRVAPARLADPSW